MHSRFYAQFLAITVGLVVATFLSAGLLAGGSMVLSQVVFLGGMVIAVLVAVSLAHFGASRIAGSIDQLKDAVRDLTGDTSPQRPQGSVTDEILAAAFELSDAAANIEAKRDSLHDEIERLSTILQSMADGVLAVDDRYRVLLANAACLEMLRLSKTGVIGRPLLEVTRLRSLYDAVGQALSRPGSLTIELNVGDDEEHSLLLRASQLPGDPCPGVVVVLHDVTEVRRLENIRKEFVANVSHELKTPLASIKAYAETLRLGAINDPEHNLGFIARIEDDANRLHELITDMLQIARIESHQQAFNLRPVDIEKQVHKCIHDMAARAEAKGIQLVVVPCGSPLSVTADEEGVQTILANLVDNAIKYTAAGGTVSVRWRAEADSMVLVVEDNGMGIETTLQDRIFERFFRVDRARTRDVGGTGLGLSIVKHLVQAFDGSVGVQSQLGEGSRFQVRLPLVRLEKVGA